MPKMPPETFTLPPMVTVGLVPAANRAFVSAASFNSSIYPFILRSVSLAGINGNHPVPTRGSAWARMAPGGDLRPRHTHKIAYEIAFDELQAHCDKLIRGGEEAELELGTIVVAVDLPGRALEEALALGAEAEAGLAAALVRLGARRLAAGGDDVARLVPEYVTLPRGVSVAKGEVRWSHDHR